MLYICDASFYFAEYDRPDSSLTSRNMQNMGVLWGKQCRAALVEISDGGLGEYDQPDKIT